jgi:hypothetical protein
MVADVAAWAAAPGASAPSGGNRGMNIVLTGTTTCLFLSPDLLQDIQAGKTVRTVFNH